MMPRGHILQRILVDQEDGEMRRDISYGLYYRDWKYTRRSLERAEVAGRSECYSCSFLTE
jgi:hypothetical protein